LDDAPFRLDAVFGAGGAKLVLDALMDAIPSCTVVAAAPDGRIVRVSEFAVHVFGHPRDQIEGRTLASVVETIQPRHADGRLLSVEELPLTRALSGEHVTGFEGRLPTGYGSIALIASNAAPLQNARGDVIGAVSTLTDMTTLKQLIAHLMTRRVPYGDDD
jgi:PAS domain S-box-containing protein